MKKSRSASSIKEVVNQVMEALSLKQPVTQRRLQQKWKEVLGEPGTLHCQILDYKDKEIVVNVDSSAWLYQLTLKKFFLLGQIQKEFPDVQKIYFKIGKVT